MRSKNVQNSSIFGTSHVRCMFPFPEIYILGGRTKPWEEIEINIRGQNGIFYTIFNLKSCDDVIFGTPS